MRRQTNNKWLSTPASALNSTHAECIIIAGWNRNHLIEQVISKVVVSKQQNMRFAAVAQEPNVAYIQQPEESETLSVEANKNIDIIFSSHLAPKNLHARIHTDTAFD